MGPLYRNMAKQKWKKRQMGNIIKKVVFWKIENSVWMCQLLSGTVEGQHKKHKVKMGKKKETKAYTWPEFTFLS